MIRALSLAIAGAAVVVALLGGALAAAMWTEADPAFADAIELEEAGR